MIGGFREPILNNHAIVFSELTINIVILSDNVLKLSVPVLQYILQVHPMHNAKFGSDILPRRYQGLPAHES